MIATVTDETISRPVQGDGYAAWIRRVVAGIDRTRPVVTLFDSSVPEPKEQIAAMVARAFAAPVTSRYTSAFVGGNPYVVAHLARAYAVEPERIVCTTGATAALSLLYRTLAAPGERILVETPGFDLFHDLGVAAGLHVDHFARPAPDFALDVDAIAAALRPDTRLVVISNLHNPSGMAADHAAMVALARLAEARGIRVIVDEVYGDYADQTARPCPAAQLSPAMVSISSLTKIFGLSTLRCGWIVGAPDVIAPVRAVADRLEFGISNLAHAVAALVMEQEAVFTRYWQDMLAAARPVMAARFADWTRGGLVEGTLPAFGCIAFPRLVGIDDTIAFADWLAHRCGVIVAPGEYFGAPGHVRIGFAQDPATLGRALDAITGGIRTYRTPALRVAVAAQ